ncbi:MarR family transcriptional regulator [Rhizobiales bacterium RZME27]|uniref:MarR family transcriptional regulator n=1 Tax=Endobacterium cereale TaxID=2663029 RepID=A0A6A8ADP5_9HYPH|nr:MarR family transcriptional regulator [Endobacterium cereale]MEB2843825.1 MarR family transcriptional regulator [Endobacterium cereale]MQY49435.1 MarR family transcriptional regulator [Endobacterium cereale]
MIVTADHMLNTHGILLRRCQQVALALFTEQAAEHGFSPTQYSALAFTYIEPGIQQNALGERIALDRSSVTKCVEILERDGLIRREVDRNDRRARMLYITPEGELVLQTVHDAALKARSRIYETMGKERFQNFLEDMKVFSAILDSKG